MSHELQVSGKEQSLPARALTVEEQMLSATELLHYANKFRGRIFSCLIGETGWLADFFLDLKVFYLAHIQMMICCVERPWLKSQIEEWNSWGYALDYVEARQDDVIEVVNLIKSSFAKQRLPVVAIKNVALTDMAPSEFHDEALNISAAAGAHRAFILGSAAGIVINGRLLSHISSNDVINVAENAEINVPANMLKYLAEKQIQYNMELVVLKAAVGSMFQEVFTHIGIGTLLSDSHKILFRGALISDARDIAFIMKPYVQKKVMLPISEDTIIEGISNFYVYTINDDVVAVAKLTCYEDGYEIGKLSTLPRYRRKGLARSMVEELIKLANKQGKKFVFSLTVEPRAMELFLALGFKEIPRHTLPLAWQAGYDFSRPSHAYIYEL